MIDYDPITHQDYIYQQYSPKLAKIQNSVTQSNNFLTQRHKSVRIVHGFFDCIKESLLYEKHNNVVLVACHKIKDLNKISVPYFESTHKVYGIHYMPPKDWHNRIDKDFSCFINRLDPSRQDFFYHLYTNNLLDKGLISFNLTLRKSLHPGIVSGRDLFDQFHNKFLSSFDYLKSEIDKIVPFKNFDENQNLSDTIMRTKFNIVIETYFERTDAITFSEKTWRSIQTPRPWLLLHSTNSIQLLRDMGFYVFDDWVDHSYDQLDTSVFYGHRMGEILKEVNRLIKQPISQTLLNHWEQHTLKNIEIMKDWSQHWQEVFTTIHDAQECALNLS
jgi:hypothetical protein